MMLNSDMDTVIEQPPGGLTRYRRAVELALNRARGGTARPPAWNSSGSEPAAPPPSDPDWAGEIDLSDVQTATTVAAPDDVRKAAENAATKAGLAVHVRTRHHLRLRTDAAHRASPGWK